MDGRTTLIKATLNTIPNYSMQIMSLLTHIIIRPESYQIFFMEIYLAKKEALPLKLENNYFL